MSGTVVRIGRYVTAHDTDVAQLGSATPQRACVYNKTSGTLIVYKLGAWLGMYDGTPKTRIFLGSNAGSGGGVNRTPNRLLGYTNEISPAVIMTDIAGGQAYTGDIAPVIWKSDYPVLGLTVGSGTIDVAMSAAAQPAMQYSENLYFYSRNSPLPSGTLPTDPIGGTPEYDGWLDLWGEAEANVAPNAPGALSPSGNVSGGSLTPTFTSTFSDPNEILNNGVAFDKLSQFRIRVLNGTTVMWDSGAQNATTAMQTAKQASLAYGGTSLAYNVSYTYQVQHADLAGAWSAWSSTTFTIVGGATVDTPSAPAGVVTSMTPGPITAVYHHQTGLSSNAVQVQLQAANGTPIATSGTIAQTVAPGGTISVTWAAAGFPTLATGQTYRVVVQARDTSNNWGPYSAVRTFYTNTTPNIPSNLSPGSSQTVTALPKLTCVTVDPDNLSPRNAGQTVTVTATIYNSAGTVLFTHPMTLRSGTTDTYDYQTTGTDLASYATYKWSAHASDGSLTSAESTIQTFTYAQGPTVSITAPGTTVTTAQPAINWSVTYTGGATQKSFQVQLYRASDGVLAYDSGVVASSSTGYTLAAAGNSLWKNGTVWHNGVTLNLVLTITDTNNLAGTNPAYAMTLSYTAPPQLNLVLALGALSGTHGTNMATLTWDQTAYSTGWQNYTIVRVANNPDAEGVVEDPVTFVITDPAETSAIDYEVTSGVNYQWTLTQTVIQGSDTLTGDASVVRGTPQFDGVLLHLPYNQDLYHVEIRSGPADQAYQHQLTIAADAMFISPLTGGKRIGFIKPVEAVDPVVNGGFFDDDLASALSRHQAFIGIIKAQYGLSDSIPKIACVREGRGTKHYGVIQQPTSQWRTNGRYDVSFTLMETLYTYGAANV